MKKILHALFLIGFVFSAGLALSQTPSSDKLTFDYDVTSCLVCGDSVRQSSSFIDSFQDQTPKTHFLKKMTVKLKYMACFTNPVSIGLNGFSKNTSNILDWCSCNSRCDSVEVVFDEYTLNWLYKYGVINQITINAPGTLYLDRIEVIREYGLRGANDAGAVWIAGLENEYTCAGTLPVNLMVANYGTNQINSVDVDWEWDGVSQTKVSSSSTIDTLGSSAGNYDTIALGNKTIAEGTSHTLKAWTTNPNSSSDTINTNDTLRLTIYGGYSDTLTIGGSSPDFATIQAAFDALSTYGVCGPVVLRVRDGTYNEQVMIRSIPGSSSTRTVTLESQSLDSSKVIVQFNASSSSSNYVIALENATNIRIRHISLVAQNSSNARALAISGKIRNFQMSSCYLQSPTTTSTSTNMAVLLRTINSTSSDSTIDLGINRCSFNGGSYGIYFANSSGFMVSNGLTIEDVNVRNHYYMGIYVTSTRNFTLTRSFVENNTSSVTWGYGIYFSSLNDAFTITRNRVSTLNGGYAFYMTSCYASSSSRALVANNFFSSYRTGSSSDGMGAYIQSCENIDFVFNSIYRLNPNNSQNAVYIDYTSGLTFRNNAVQNAGNGQVFAMQNNTSSTLTANRNLYFNNNTGAGLGTWSGNTIRSIEDIKQKVNQDSNSYSANPFFKSSSDLHAYSVDLDANASPVSGVSTDIDGETRNATTPDIGADEFNLAPLDAGVVQILPFLSGSQCVNAIIRNYGSTTLTSMNIGWQLNGSTQTAYSWTGSLTKGDTALVCLGTVSFSSSTLYNIKAWTYAPNSGTDTVAFNDTATYESYPAMRGVYTIGGTSPDYATFAAAVSDLNQRGVLDSVWFRVRSGTYTERFTLNEIRGAGKWASVIFESETKNQADVILTTTSANSSSDFWLVRLNGADGVSFRNMTLRNLSTSYKNIFYVINLSNNLEISNCVLETNDSISTSYYYSLYLSDNNYGSEGLKIQNNVFRNGSYGMNFYGNSNSRIGEVTISGNRFLSQSYMGIYSYNMSNTVIENNIVTSAQGGVNYYIGIYIQYLRGVLNISGNQIYLTAGTNLNSGLNIYDHFGDTARIFNNMISVYGTRSGAVYGMYTYYLRQGLIAYNTILNTNLSGASSNSAALYTGGGNLSIYNNALIHSNGGYAHLNDWLETIRSNNNNLFTSGSRLVRLNGSTDYAGLSAWQATGRDTNSISSNSTFKGSRDLHTVSLDLNAKGRPVFGITKDMDGDTRDSSKPDIGADEYFPQPVDAGVIAFVSPGEYFAPDSNNITVAVYNYGLDTIKSVTVHAGFNTDTLTRVQVNRNIPSGDSIHVYVGRYRFLFGTSYTFRSYTSNPNSGTDGNNNNDTFVQSNRSASYAGIYTIGGTTPDFTTIQSAYDSLTKYGVGGPVELRVRNGVYNEQVTVRAIKGGSASNHITLISEARDSTAVTVNYSSGSGNNFVFYLENASHLRFRYITFEALNATNSRVFSMNLKLKDIEISNSRLLAPVTTSSSTVRSLVFRTFSNSFDSLLNIRFLNSVFDQSAYGIYLSNSSTSGVTRGIRIEGCRFTNQYTDGVLSFSNRDFYFKNNYVLNRTNSVTNFEGLYITDTRDTIEITGNQIYTRNGGIPLRIQDAYPVSAKRGLIANNMFSTDRSTSSSSSQAVSITASQNIDFVHNSIRRNNPNTSESAFNLGSVQFMGLYNNAIQNIGGGTAFSFTTNGTVLASSDNNLYFNNGGTLGTWAGTTISTIADFPSKVQKDSNSRSANPNFVSAIDLHAYSVDLDKKGRRITGVTRDIDGTLRDTLRPDIGADEFELLSRDITPVAVQRFTAGRSCATVQVRNAGNDTITSFTVNWWLNGVSQTSRNWTGSLATGDTASVCLDSITFASDSIYNFEIRTSAPNSSSDLAPGNDTLRTQLRPAMRGIYTIGGTTPDFATFNAAVTALHTRGVLDSAWFRVRSGTYTEQVSINQITGASKWASVIFEAENKDSSSVILTTSSSNSSNNYTVRLNGADGISFRRMTIQNNTTSNRRVFYITGIADNNEISNCQIQNNDSINTTTSNSLITADNTSSSGLLITGNTLWRGSHGVLVGPGSSRIENVVITNNRFVRQGYMGLDMYNVNNFRFSSNEIEGIASNYYMGAEIYSFGGTVAEFANNKINLNANSNLYYGVYFSSYNGTDTLRVFNNFLRTKSTTYTRALYLGGIDRTLIAYNNVLNDAGDSSSSMVIYTYGNNIRFYNNNLVSINKGHVWYHESGSIASDNNNYFTNGSRFVYFNYSTYSNLAALRTIGRDSNSLSVDPLFVSNTDLHTGSVAINGKGRPIVGITTDIDGETRNASTPDIGADEFQPPANDAGVNALVSPSGIIRADSNEIVLQVFNFGIDTVKSVKVYVKINSDTLPTVTLTKIIAPGDTAQARMGKYRFSAGTSYDITAFTDIPNGLADDRKTNDTLKITGLQTALSGVYTIGGTTPDFTTFTDALNALNTRGVIDSVRFRVRSGNYNEQLVFTPIPGVSGTANSVIFESESLDSSSVNLNFTPTSSNNNYVVFFNGADGITFRNLTLESSASSSWSTVVRLEGGNDNIILSNNRLIGRSTSSSSSNYYVIQKTSSNGRLRNLRVINNNIINGSAGVYLYGYNGSSSEYAYSNIEGNTFMNQGYYGVYLDNMDSARIHNNRLITTSTSTPMYYGIYAYYWRFKGEITNNVFNTHSTYGIYVNYIGPDGNLSSMVANNAINIFNNSTVYGLYISENYRLSFIHNTINLKTSSNPTHYGVYIGYYGSNNRFVNNNISLVNGYTIYYPDVNLGNQFTSFNYNNYYKPSGTGLFYYTSNPVNSLADWRTTTGLDGNSKTLNPSYVSSDSLRPTEIGLYRSGSYFSNLAFDVSGMPRDTQGADIGAYNVDIKNLDAQLFDVITPKMPFGSDTQSVRVIVRNVGKTRINSLSVAWELNGARQSNVSVSDTLNTGDTAWITLGTKVFSRDTAYQFRAWTFSPNGSTDQNNANDTVRLQDQYPALSGIYTVGGATPDFSNIGNAIMAMYRGGILDSVRFDIRSGTYNEKLILKPVLGANNPNSIIFQSQNRDSSQVVITASSNWNDNYVVLLDSALGVTFRYLTLSSTSGTYTTLVDLRGNARNIGFENCRFEGNPTASTSTSNCLVYAGNSSSVVVNDIRFARNAFINGSYGIYFYQYHSNGNAFYGSGLDIRENTFENQYYVGLMCYYVNNMDIHRNKIYDVSNRYSSSYGIYIYENRNGLRITGNNIYNKGYAGLEMDYCYGKTGDSILIANNMIQVAQVNTNSFALYTYGGSHFRIVNNNFSGYSGSNTSGRTVYLNLSNPQTIVNNNFYQIGSGWALQLDGSSPNIINNNNYYSTGSQLNRRSSTNYNTLAQWQSSLGFDANGLSVDPQYISATDLHVRNFNLNAAGRNMWYLIKEDFDGQRRDSLKPDIGADEFDIPSANDAGIAGYTSPVLPFTSGTNTVRAVIRNYGSDTLKTANIHWAVNGTAQSTYSWSGALALGQTDTVSLGNFNFLANTRYDLDFWTRQPNSVTDTITWNDSFRVADLYPALSGTYTVGGLLPDFNTLTEAVSRLNRSGIINNVNFNIRSGTYDATLLLEPYPGAQPGRRVTFQSENGDSSSVILRLNGSTLYGNQLVHVRGADYLTFNKLTFDISNRGTFYGVLMNNAAQSVTFSNCRFNMSTITYSQLGIYSSSDKDDSLRVVNCVFNNGANGIYTYGLSASREEGIVIENNRFINQWSSALVMYYAQNFRVLKNYFENAAAIYYTAGTPQLAYNNFVVTRNGVNSIYWNEHAGNSTQRAMIYNNMVSTYTNSSSNSGMAILNASYVDIYHNTVHMYGGTSANSEALLLQSANSIDSRNNSFTNAAAGYALYLTSSGLSQSNYNNLHTNGTNLGYVTGSVYNNLNAWRSATSRDANSISVSPVFNSNTDLHTGLINLDSAATPIASVTDDFDGQARNATHPDIGADEFQSLPNNMGLSAILYPIESCNMDSVRVKVNIYNYGNLKQSNFPVRYRLNGGSVVSENFTDSILAGQTKEFEFTTKEKLQKSVLHELVVWTDLSGEQFRANDTLKSSFYNFPIPDTITSMFPADSIENLSYPFTLSWLPSNGATRYDVYIWADTAAKPSSPAFSNTTAISVQVSSGLVYGQRYKWQVHAKNANCETPGRVRHFRMKFLPDLIVEEAKGPSSAFSGNSVSVSWKIKNTGLGQASGNWWDAIYLSTDKVFDGSDVLLTAVQNPSGLNSNQNYSQSANVTLPNGISGKYYFIIRTDAYSNLLETNNNNNEGADTVGTNVTLTPPPDLVVTSIVRQATGFSGNNTNVLYTVKNTGTGATRSGSWSDRIYLSKDTVFDGSDYNLRTITRTGNLQKDSAYSNSVTVTLPNFISGGHYFFVRTDVNNNEYEHGSENNNTTRSDSINVILTPPADLIVTDLVAPSVVSNREQVNISYLTINDGGTSTGTYFWDQIYISGSSVFNASAIPLADIFLNSLAAGDTHVVSRTVTIPNNMNGQAYWYVVTDYTNRITELTGEGNNTVTRNVQVKSPDLTVNNVVVPTQDTTGHTFTINYNVVNLGPGKARNDTRTDSVFISTLDTFNRALSTPVAALRYTPSASLDSGAVMSRSGNITIPDGFDGDRYFYVHTDAAREIFENIRDNNNTGRSNKMTVILAPYPDLRPVWVSYPDSSAAGESVTLVLDIENRGDTTARPNWRERIYLSKDSVFNPTNVLELTNVLRGGDLLKNESYNLSRTLTLPAALSMGNYYFYAYTDADGNVYEHTNENNNIRRSNKVFIDGYPPVDLQVSCPTHVDTMYSGTNYSFSFTVTNIGQAQTGQNAWGDAIYLSTDTIWQSTDLLLKQINRTGALAKNASYNVNTQVSIPNGLSGTYYLLALTDELDVNKDDDRSNNYRAKCAPAAVPVTIILTASPDLQVTSFDIPGTGTTGQPLSVKWTVSNKGTGKTRNGSWSDRFYLSANATLDASDVLIGTKNRTGNLDTNQFYNDSISVSIPSNITGNYYLFIHTDQSNVEYEHNLENNNTVASVVSFTPAPPADLIVSGVTAPDSVISGDVVTVTWSVKNNGSNPTTGWMTDNIYLSEDDKVDAGDKLLTSVRYVISLAPNAQSTRNQNVEISGVSLGDYFVLVSTDVLNNINESNDTNNVGTTSGRINVNVPELILGVKKQDTLFNNKGKYYRMQIPANLEGESVLITLKGDSINGDNQLFVRRSALASGSQFDYKFRDPFKGNQEIIIPEVFEGTYYIYLIGKTSVGASQPVSLLAEILPFSIRRVTPNRGGNGGEVTLKIEGSKFEPGMAFYLENKEDRIALEDSGAPVYSEKALLQSRFEYEDPTIVYATFNLNGKDTGMYDVSTTKGAETAILRESFKIEGSTDEDLEFEVVRPGTTRTNAVIAMTVYFTNKGNNDVVNRKVQVVSSQGAPIGFSEAELNDNKTTLDLLLEDNDGPPGRLRAGSSGSAKVYIRATTGLGIIITQ